MENERLRERYRVQLATLHGMTVTVVSVLEIVAYFILAAAGEESWSIQSRYLWVYVVLPIAINMLAHTVVRLVGKNEKCADTVKISTLVYESVMPSFESVLPTPPPALNLSQYQGLFQ